MKIPLPLFGFYLDQPVLLFGRVFDLCLLEKTFVFWPMSFQIRLFLVEEPRRKINMVKHPDYIEENEDDPKMIRSF